MSKDQYHFTCACDKMCDCEVCKHDCDNTEVVSGQILQPVEHLEFSDDIYHQLVNLRSSLCPPTHSTASFMLGTELATGLSDQLLHEIASNYSNIDSIDILLEMGVGGTDVAYKILNIIMSYYKD